MKKVLNSVLFWGLGALLFTACSKEDINQSPVQNNPAENIAKSHGDSTWIDKYFADHVALFDSRNRSLNSSTFVSELYFIDFSNNPKKMPYKVVVQDVTFLDDGTLHDKVANDGIFTSIITGNHNVDFPYLANETIRSIQRGPIVSSNFLHSNSLKNTYGNYEYAAVGIYVELSCDIEFGTSGCLADDWGWCDDCCFTISNCHSITVGVGS